MREGYSAQDSPGERYDAHTIDYGAYVNLINTKNYPDNPGVPLPLDISGDVEVPGEDLGAIRRAILDLDESFEANPRFNPMAELQKWVEQAMQQASESRSTAWRLQLPEGPS